MNIRRGLFRFWIVFSILFIAWYGILTIPKIKDEFEIQSTLEKPINEMQPWDRYKLSMYSDEELLAFAKLPPGFEIRRPSLSKMILDYLLFSIGIPALFLIFGFSIIWAANGFKKVRP